MNVAPEFQYPDKMVSKSGRKLSPYPDKIGQTNRSVTINIRKEEAWCLKEAILEAECCNDEYNTLMFRGELSILKQGLPTASLEAINWYLFGRECVKFIRG